MICCVCGKDRTLTEITTLYGDHIRICAPCLMNSKEPNAVEAREYMSGKYGTPIYRLMKEEQKSFN